MEYFNDGIREEPHELSMGKGEIHQTVSLILLDNVNFVCCEMKMTYKSENRLIKGNQHAALQSYGSTFFKLN